MLGEAEKDDKDALPSLDSFLAKHTSEDNASFEQIMEVAKEKEKVKHAWLYSAEEEYTQVGKGSAASLLCQRDTAGKNHLAVFCV